MKLSFNNKLLKSKKGQGLIEYLILVALIAVGTIAVIKVVGQNVTKQYERVNRALGANGSSAITLEGVADSQMKKKDLSNFMEGAK